MKIKTKDHELIIKNNRIDFMKDNEVDYIVMFDHSFLWNFALLLHRIERKVKTCKTPSKVKEVRTWIKKVWDSQGGK